MSPFKISWKSLLSNPLTSSLNILLIAFGSGILAIILLASIQISDKLDSNSKDIDLVVGAKGSPLQLILSSIYYVDFPTGNISLKEANELSRNRMVKRVVPLALGDSYNGFRIVGTDTSFINLYSLTLSEGKYWTNDFEVTIGSEVAKAQKLKVGDKFHGGHGLTTGGDIHKTHAYIVTGILKVQNNVTDNLVLTNISSIWKMHSSGDGEDHENHSRPDDATDEQHHTDSSHPLSMLNEGTDKEITSLLIQYRSPMAVAIFPRLVNKSTNMQAASPALESARLFSLVGMGIDTLKWFAFIIVLIASISVFVSLFNSLKERKYDIALMRVMGASKIKIFLIIVLEGIILSIVGTVLGIAIGHVLLEIIGSNQDAGQARLTGKMFIYQELYLLLAGILIGIIAAVIPAWKAYRSDIITIISGR